MEKHPLLIEDIVKLITKYFDYKNVQVLRAVHPSWNNAILSRKYLDNTVLRINFEYKSLQDFLDTFPIETTTPVPVQLLKTVYLDYFHKVILNPKFIEWFEIYGRNIRHLTVNKNDHQLLKLEVKKRKKTTARIFVKQSTVYSNNPEGKSQIMARLLSDSELLPNLESLNIPLFDFGGHHLCSAKELTLQTLTSLEIGTGHIFLPAGINPECVNCIVKSAPHLQILRLWIEPKDMNSQFLERRQSFFGVQPEYLVKLTELELSGCGEESLPMSSLQMLANVKFINLKRLALNNVTADDDGPKNEIQMEFKKLLENVRHSLEYFDSGYTTFSFSDNMMPDEMNNMKELTVRTNLFTTMDSADFLTKLPKLNSLVVEQLPEIRNPVMVCTLFNSNVLLQNHLLKKLQLQDIYVQTDELRRLVTISPNLESLSILKTDYTMKPVIWDLPQFLCALEGLVKLADLRFCFTIISSPLDQHGTSFKKGIIQNLPKLLTLQKCTIICKPNAVRICLKTVEKGFLKTPSLKSLNLHNFIIEPNVKSLLVQSIKETNLQVKLTECYSLLPVNL